MSIAVFRIGLAAAKTVVDQAYGSALAPGRWHSLRMGAASRRVIYCAGSRALAQLEKRVHANGIAPVGQALFRLELPDGLDPDFLGDIAGFSGLESRDVLDFVGIDRTTVSRRKASGAALPQDVAVKALQITELLTQATEVFGSPTRASTWLTRTHPLLDGETPLRRARTPWGMSKVQSMLVALRYGAAA